MAKILIVDDDKSILELLSELLSENGHNIKTAEDGQTALRLIEDEFFEIMITDLVMPGMDGIELMEKVLKISPYTKCIILTGYGTIKSSVEAIKKGAFDYITKPVSVSELLVTIENALKMNDLEKENRYLRSELRRIGGFENIVGTSRAMQKVFEVIKKVSDTDCTVLITGSSGTGKELVARAIHSRSNRNDKPFVVINCGAIPEELLESELFGHEKGAFTGAHKRRIGRFEMADGGTIFLDEISEMSPSLQVKLLRVLQEREFERVGGIKPIKVDVRIIAATNRDLKVAIKEGKFREDLYYRLNVIPIHLPDLRDRKSDIPLLIDHFLRKYSKESNGNIKGITKKALSIFMRYNWPGNIRELKNIIKRIIVLSDGDIIDVDDIPEYMKEDIEIEDDRWRLKNMKPIENGMGLNEAVREFEKRLIMEALENSNGITSRAAKILKINRTTLIEKIKKQKIDKVAVG